MSSKNVISNKHVYKFGKSVKKHRLRYWIINECFWFTYLYTVFMAVTQFKQARFDLIGDVVNVLLAIVVLVVFFGYTCFVINLGRKYKGKGKENEKGIPRKWSFIVPEPSQFPL